MTRYDKRSVVVETEVQDTPEFRSWLNNMSGDLEYWLPNHCARPTRLLGQGSAKETSRQYKAEIYLGFVYF